MSQPEYDEESVKACYKTWSGTYYDDYYAAGKAYPPVHSDLIRRLLQEERIGNLLDAGCGPASFLRLMAGEGIDLYGFDLTPGMVEEARKILAERGVPSQHIWQGSVLDAGSCRFPENPDRLFDAAICIGVLPHVPVGTDTVALKNIGDCVKKNGLVIVEARNQLFSLFTLNRYTFRFLKDELIRSERLLERSGENGSEVARLLAEMERYFRVDMPPVRKGKNNEPGYDEIVSRTHNPLILKEEFASSGFRDVKLLFYHYHCLPPMFEPIVPEMFRRESLAMEDPEDWRGHFMASAFLLAGRRM